MHKTWMSYEEEDTCMSYEEEDTCMSYEEEDTCMSYEEDTWMHKTWIYSQLHVNTILLRALNGLVY